MLHHTFIQNILIWFGHQLASIWFKHIFSCMTRTHSLSLLLSRCFFCAFFFLLPFSELWALGIARERRRTVSKMSKTVKYKLREWKTGIEGVWDVCWFICSLSESMKCSTLTFHRYKIIYSAGVLSQKWRWRVCVCVCVRKWTQVS